MQVSGHTFLISGGSSGLGAACGRELVGAGATAVIADVNQAAGEALAGALGARVRFSACNVTDEASVQAALNMATETYGGLQGVICCAGIASAEKILGKSGPHGLSTFTKVVQVN